MTLKHKNDLLLLFMVVLLFAIAIIAMSNNHTYDKYLTEDYVISAFGRGLHE